MMSNLGPARPQIGPTREALTSVLSDLLVVEGHREATHHWAEARLATANRSSAALRVAVHIASQRCGGAPQYFDAWLARHDGGPPHDPELLDCLLAFLGSESIGTQTEPAEDKH